MREHIPARSVDLIYLDPPFNTEQDYNVLFRDERGVQSEAQIRAFKDTWHWTLEAESNFRELTLRGDSLGNLLDALRPALGKGPMLAYLVMMAARLPELHRVLKPTGSLYLHCDPTASHYLKMLLDMIFGPENFRNEIIWQRSRPHGNVTKKYGAIHDVIFFYAKSNNVTWNRPALRHDRESDERIRRAYNRWDEERQDWWQSTSLLNPNTDRPNLTYEFMGHTKVWRWTRARMEEAYRRGEIYIPPGGGVPRYKRYLGTQRGKLLQDIWTDIPPLTKTMAESLDYPTQKPLALLKRIIQASSNPGDVVLDPFLRLRHGGRCGAGSWGGSGSGFDITHRDL